MLTVTAVYKDGALFPIIKLNLPNDTQVQLQIVDMPATTPPATSAFGSLAGIWANLTDTEVSQVQQAIDDYRQQSSRRLRLSTEELA